MQRLFDWLDKNQNLGLVLIRLFAGIRLVYGVADNIMSWERMLEFSTFLQSFHFPFPLAAAIVSVYAQALAGILFITGWKVRYAAILMVLNFTTALITVHRNDTFEQMTPALALLFISILLLFTGNKIGSNKLTDNTPTGI
jgi:putative oxidoreductase